MSASTTSTTDISVLGVDDNAVVRMGLTMLIEAMPGLSVVGEADSGQACVEPSPSWDPTSYSSTSHFV